MSVSYTRDNENSATPSYVNSLKKNNNTKPRYFQIILDSQKVGKNVQGVCALSEFPTSNLLQSSSTGTPLMVQWLRPFLKMLDESLILDQELTSHMPHCS